MKTKQKFGLPNNVYDKFLQATKSRSIEHYIGDRRRLKPLAELIDDPVAPVVIIYGSSLDNFKSKGYGNRVCRRLVKQGLLKEIHRNRKTSAVQFVLSDINDSESLIRMAHTYWVDKGYKEGVIMECIT